jgi:hypothetical protein
VIDKEVNEITVAHLYGTWNTFTVTVEAFNHVSNDTKMIRAVVLDWPCFYPNMTLPYYVLDPNAPLQRMKSETFSIPANVSMYCLKADNVFLDLKIYKGATVVLDLTDVTAFDFVPRMLGYGKHTLTFKARMTSTYFNISDIFTTADAYLEITKTPLVTSIDGLSYVAYVYNRTYSKDAISHTIDPDVEPGDKNGLQFTWCCKQEIEVWGTSCSTIAPEVEVDPPDPFLGCFGGGPGKLTTSGAFDLNTGKMMVTTAFTLKATVTKDTRSASFVQDIYVGLADPPRVNIT